MKIAIDGPAGAGKSYLCHELAKKYGIKTAETVYSARKKCPDLVIASPHYDEYTKYSRAVNDIYARYSRCAVCKSGYGSFNNPCGSGLLHKAALCDFGVCYRKI